MEQFSAGDQSFETGTDLEDSCEDEHHWHERIVQKEMILAEVFTTNQSSDIPSAWFMQSSVMVNFVDMKSLQKKSLIASAYLWPAQEEEKKKKYIYLIFNHTERIN